MTKWINRMAYKFRRYGIDNLMLYITASMLTVYLAQNLTGLPIYQLLALNRELVLQGQVWRLITFIFLPQGTMILWVLLSLYLYYFIGSTLENTWGRTKFTMFYAFGVLGAIIAGMLSGYGNNMYLNMSMFLAFAALWPDYELMLFLVLPVKVKILAYIDLAMLTLWFIAGGWSEKAAIVFSLLNLILFFGDDLYSKLKDSLKRRKARNRYREFMDNQK